MRSARFALFAAPVLVATIALSAPTAAAVPPLDPGEARELCNRCATACEKMYWRHELLVEARDREVRNSWIAFGLALAGLAAVGALAYTRRPS